MADDTRMLNANVRCIELTSRTTFELGENGQWNVISRDRPVTEQFNQWADQNNMNPAMTPTIGVYQFVEAPNRISVVHSLCASAINRDDQLALELSYREHVARVLLSLTNDASAAAEAANAVAAAGMTPPVGKPAGQPVSVPSLAEQPLDPNASEVTMPAVPFPGPGA